MTQLDFSCGIGLETTFNTAVAPTRFYESEAKFKYDVKRGEGKGLRPTKSIDRLRRNFAKGFEGSGDLEIEATNKGLGFLLNAVMGSVTSTLVSTGLYQQVHTLAVDDPIQSYTIQEVIPFLGGAGQPHTFTGCVAESIEISTTEGDTVSVKIAWLATKLLTATAATATSYPAGDSLFTFVGGSILLGGTLTAPTGTLPASMTGTALANISAPSVVVKNSLDKGGFNLGGAGYRSRKPLLGKREVSGKFTAEYTDNTLRDAYLNQTPLSLLLNFVHEDGTSQLQIAIPAILLKGEVPATNGGEPAKQSIDFKAYDNETAVKPIWVVYRTSDTTP